MITATIQEAKAKLNELIQKTLEGEQVILLRGSKIIATLLPLSEKDLEISTRLTDSQAENFWQEVSSEKSKEFKTLEATENFLKSK